MKIFAVEIWVDGCLICGQPVRAQTRDEAIFDLGKIQGALAPNAQMNFEGHIVKFIVAEE
jgi:hypothetical protein